MSEQHDRLKNKLERLDKDETVQILAREGRELLHQGNRRRIIAREPDGKMLLDISVTQAVIASVLIALFLPIGWLVLLGLVGYGISKKVRLDFVRELSEGDENATISMPKLKHDELYSRDSGDDSSYDTMVEDEPLKAKRG